MANKGHFIERNGAFRAAGLPSFGDDKISFKDCVIIAHPSEEIRHQLNWSAEETSLSPSENYRQFCRRAKWANFLAARVKSHVWLCSRRSFWRICTVSLEKPDKYSRRTRNPMMSPIGVILSDAPILQRKRYIAL